MTDMRERFEALGYRVATVPELATLMFNSLGLQASACGEMTQSQLLVFESSLVRLQLEYEKAVKQIARALGQSTVVLHDRGCMDLKAYMPSETWDALTAQLGQTDVSLRDQRYDGIIHLVTAAKGAEKFYTTANNNVRSEGLQQARDLDDRTLQAWVGHEHHYVIDNSTNFNDKIRRATDSVQHLLGVPNATGTKERKFLLKSANVPASMAMKEFDVEQVYLRGNKPGASRIRKKTANGGTSYSHQTVTQATDGTNVRIARNINAREYMALLSEADPNAGITTKKLKIFNYGGQMFEINEFPDGGLVLEVFAASATAPVSFPPFLSVTKEVTEDPKWDSYGIAKERKSKSSK